MLFGKWVHENPLTRSGPTHVHHAYVYVRVHTRLSYKGNNDVCRERIINFKTSRRNISSITQCKEIAET